MQRLFLVSSLIIATSYAQAGLKVPDGFVAEQIYAVPNAEQGSWISLAFDDKGNLYAGSEKHGIYRMTVPAAGGQISNVEHVAGNLGAIQGLLVAFDSLYAMNNDKSDKSGLYRLQDSTGDGTLDKREYILPMDGRGGHGLHGIILSPDGKTLTINSGNMGKLPAKIAHSRVPQVWAEDQLLPRLPDSNGHASTIYAPGGWTATINPDGSNVELIANGFRNEYDVAYNAAGDLFTFDADMEYDMGTPWYRPTRVCHVVSGGEYGWRNGSGKWPAYFADSLPSVLDIGPSSPTGIFFGTNTKFPTRYQQALFICDWTYGQIYTIDLQAKGASYTATKEVFCSGRPFPVVDAIIGPDGAIYAVTGGRNITSAVWRIRYDGTESQAAPAPPKTTATAQLRQQLEAMHRPTEGAVDRIWPHLNHDDRFVRFAARIALEHQSVASWQARVFAESDPIRVIQTAIALTRHGDASVNKKLAAKLQTLSFAALDAPARRDLLRALSLLVIRMDPAPPVKSDIADYLKAHFPDKDETVNRELVRVLVALGEPSVVPGAVELMNTIGTKQDATSEAMLSQDQHGNYKNSLLAMKTAPPPSAQMYYATILRNAQDGWTPALRLSYAKWLNSAEKQAGGRSYKGYIKRIRKDAFRHLSDAERAPLISLEAENASSLANLPQPKGPGQHWTVDSVLAATGGGLKKRDFQNGQKMYAAVLCASCHQFAGQGGAVGPDLTQLGTRFPIKDIAAAIIHPSEVISDQYESKVITLKSGAIVMGRIISESKNSYSVSSNPFAPDKLETIPRNKVSKVEHSKVSMMPPALINRLNREEMLDLLAYMTSAGNPNDSMFK